MPKHGPFKIIAGPRAGRWRYCAAGQFPRPIGYCAQACAGHDDAAGAVDHWLKFVADQCAFYAPAEGLPMHSCDVRGCGIATSGHALVGAVRVNLCDKHRDVEGLLSVVTQTVAEEQAA